MLVILGEHGQLARSFRRLFPQAAVLGSRHFSFAQPQPLLHELSRLKARVILNASAFTAVDLAETQTDLAHQINAYTPGLLAQWSSENGARLLHFSTDYVFSGEGSEPWRETSPTSPINVYGASKLLGEQKILETSAEALIFRISWVCSAVGKNFLLTMLRLAQTQARLRIVHDQVGQPSFADEIGNMVKIILEQKDGPRRGLFHLSGALPESPDVSWAQFAEEIFQQAQDLGILSRVPTIEPILSHQYPTPARRPLNSRLSNEFFCQTFGLKMRSWKEGLRSALIQLRDIAP
jgi:dTDP-4-dehydrorhamnose reductase